MKNASTRKSSSQSSEQTTKKSSKRQKAINRLLFSSLIFLVFIIIGTILLNKSFKFNSEKITKYSEKSNLDYKVYLQKNEFYEQQYLGKDMLYVASLIDNVLIDFDYNFQSENNEDINFTYSIAATLTISNAQNTKSYFVKTYRLTDDKVIKMTNANIQNIHEQIKIDYPYYNTLANSFKNQYGLDTESKLTVFMIVNKKNGENSNFVMDNDSIMNIAIPLSERAVDISLDYKEINETRNIVEKQNVALQSIIMFVVAIVLIIIALIMLVRAMRLFNKLLKKKSIYDKYVGKILKEYDRLIAESTTLMSFEDKEVIKINKFTELLDIHDNLQKPIMYYSVVEHETCYFYINNDNVVYILTIEKADLEEQNEEKKV